MNNQALSLVVGRDKDGKEIAFDLVTLPHLLMCGCTGSGKSVCLKLMIAELMHTKGLGDVSFVLYDEKSVEFGCIGDSPYLRKPVITDPEAFLAELENLEDEIKARVGNWELQGLPRIIVVADEIAELMVHHGQRADALLSRILVNAGVAGVHFIFATQRPDEIVLSGALRCGFPGRMVFKIYGREYSDLLIAGCDAESLNGKGEFLLQDSQGVCRGQGDYISDEELESQSKEDFIDESDGFLFP